MSNNSSFLMNVGNGDGMELPARLGLRKMESLNASKSKGSVGTLSNAGEAERSKFQSLSFARIYREVAAANRDAQRCAECKIGEDAVYAARDKTSGYERHEMQEDIAEIELEEALHKGDLGAETSAEVYGSFVHEIGATLHGSEDASVREVANQQREAASIFEQASLIVKTSLLRVSSVFSLKLVDDLDRLKIGRIDDELIKQCAEILYMMERLAKILFEAGSLQESVEIGGRTMQGEQLFQIGKMLRVEAFNLRIAFSMLGISSEVSHDIAAKSNVPLMTGVPQAIDPVSLSMSLEEIQHIFKELIANRERELRELLGHMAAILRREADSSVSTSQQPERRVFSSTAPPHQQQALVASGALEGRFVSAKSMLEACAFDAIIMRRLLKIDPPQVLAVLNREAAARLDQNPMFDIKSLIVSKNLSVDVGGREGVVLPIIDVLVRHGNTESFTSLLGPQLGGLVRENIEQMVMGQIIEKCSIALRTGINEVRLILHPESLGEVKVKIEIHQEVVSARIQVESLAVKQIVENNLQALRDALQEHHLQTGTLDVSVGDGATHREVVDSDDRLVHTEEKAEQTAEGHNGASLAKTDGVELGVNTGRRYGNNSVEYFA